MWFNYCTAIVEQGDFQYKRMFGREGRKEFRIASWGYRNIMHSQINAFIKNKWRTVLKKIDTLTDAANMQVITMSCVPLEFGQNKPLMPLIGDSEFGALDFYVSKSIFSCTNSNIKSKTLSVF